MMLGSNIKNLRKQVGFSQKELAAMIEQTPTSIMHYEKGDREPSLEIIEKNCNCIECETTGFVWMGRRYVKWNYSNISRKHWNRPKT